MKKSNLILILFVIYSIPVFSQQYSFSIFAFRIWDGDSLITSLHGVKGFNHYYGTKIKMDSLSGFEVNAIYLNEDADFQNLAEHKKGVWLLFSENVKQWRPIRFFSIQKKETNGKVQVMRIFLNYNYHSCEMPCVFGKSEFKTSDILFKEGNYLILNILDKEDWNKQSPNIVNIKGDIFGYIIKHDIILWDINMIK